MKQFLLLIAALLPAALFPGRVFSGERDPRLRDYYCEETKKPFFAETPGEKGRFAPQRTDAQPDTFLMPKPAGRKRVFVIGESVAALLGPGQALAGDRIIGKKLLDKLRGAGTAEDNAGIEIVNCGMGGYESHRIYGVLKEILAYSPDLVVVLSGNNDTKEESCPGFECELRRRKFRLYERYFSLFAPAREARQKALLKLHGAMLLKMAGAAKKAGVPLVFCTLPAAVRDMPPRQPAPLENRDFALGYRLFYAGRNAEALAAFRRGLAADRREPFLNFYAARTLDRLGRREEAAASYYKALDLDWTMARAGSERNGLIRRAAAAGGACVADLEKLFRELPPAGLPGFAEFTDGMHWNYAHNKEVWEELFRAAGRCGIKGFEHFTAGGPGSWVESPRETALKRLGYAFAWIDEKNFNEGSLAELARIREDRPELLKDAGASPERLDKLLLKNLWSAERIMRLKELYPFFLAHLAETERRARNYPPALSLCDRALALKPGHPLLKFGRVQVLADMGGKAEDEFLDLAQERSLGGKAASVAAAYGFKAAAGPAPGGGAASAGEPATKKNAALSKKIADQAVEKVFSKDYKAAEELFEAALEKNPFNPEALMSLCYLRRKDGRTRQAAEACQRAASAIYRDPANRIPSLELLACDAALESYSLLKTLKRAPETADLLGQCVKKPPPSWPGLDAAKAALGSR